MKVRSEGDKLIVHREPAELTPYRQRLARIEGQVRGVRHMIESNRYCGEAIQQSSAIIAGMREVALMLISQQLQSHVENINTAEGMLAAAHHNQGMSEFVDLLRASYRFQ